MSKEKDILFGVLTKAFVKSEEELNSIIYGQNGEVKEDALDSLLKMESEKIQRVKKDSVDVGFNNGYKKAQAETLSDFENKFKTKFSFNSEQKGLDLVEEFISKNTKSNLTNDDVRKHPSYIELERNSVRRSDFEKLQSEYEGYRKQLEKEKVINRVNGKALEILEKLNPVIEDNPRVAQKRKDMFLKEFEQYDYEFDSDYVIPVRDGKRIQDDHANAIGFETLVRNVAESYFTLNKQQYRQSAGNDGGSSGGKYLDVPRNEREYMEALAKETDPAKRVALKNAYKAVAGKQP